MGQIDHLLPALPEEPLNLIAAIGEGGGLGGGNRSGRWSGRSSWRLDSGGCEAFLSGGQESKGVPVLGVQGQGILRPLLQAAPVSLGEGGFSFVQQPVDLPLYSLAGHNGGIVRRPGVIVYYAVVLNTGKSPYRKSDNCGVPVPIYGNRQGRTSQRRHALDRRILQRRLS